MQLQVQKIASIQFRHDYFKLPTTDWNSEWPTYYTQDYIPEVIATKSSLQKLKDWGFYLRKTPQGFDLIAEVKKTGSKVFHNKSMVKNEAFYFYLTAPTGAWANVTKMRGAQNGLSVFSNSKGLKPTGANSNFYLHNELPESYTGTKQAGEVVRKGNKIYEATERTTTKPPGSRWVEIGDREDYTTLSNKTPIVNQFLQVQETSLAGAVIEIKDAFGVVILNHTIDSTSIEKTFNLDVSSLLEGLYTYSINATEKDQFFKADNAPNRTFAVVQLVFQNNPAALSNTIKLDQDWLPIANGQSSLQQGQINPRTFIVHFLPNRAKWKYIFSKEIAIDVADVNAAGFQKLSNTAFISTNVMSINKSAQGADFGLDQRLPAASTNHIVPQYNASEEIETYVSEIYVNV